MKNREWVLYRWDTASVGTLYFIMRIKDWDTTFTNKEDREAREILARGTEEEMQRLWKLTKGA